MAGGSRSAAVKKAWITRRRGRGGAASLTQKMKRAQRLGTGEMMHGATPKYTTSWKQVSTNLGRAVRGGGEADFVAKLKAGKMDALIDKYVAAGAATSKRFAGFKLKWK